MQHRAKSQSKSTPPVLLGAAACVLAAAVAHAQSARPQGGLARPRPSARPSASAAPAASHGHAASTPRNGRPRIQYRHPSCGMFATPDSEGAWLYSTDIRPTRPAVRGDDLLALVNRGAEWTLGADYAPSDLVNVHSQQPMTAALCSQHGRMCLRTEAATAYRQLTAAMEQAHFPPFLDSAYRSFSTQCFVFGKWAYLERNGFCHATHGSALPGHSQHQLGTVVDLFSAAWVAAGSRFRAGFGCTPAGRWLAAHAHEYGFVLSYPLNPDLRAPNSDCLERSGAGVDPRTGYKYEPWHFRYIGVENARRYTAARDASGVGTSNEITLEQWLRTQIHERQPIDPPVCDGCDCDQCATFAPPGEGPCGTRGLHLDEHGDPLPASGPPSLRNVTAERARDGALVVRATVEIPANTVTQTPVRTGNDVNAGVRYPARATYRALAGVNGGLTHNYEELSGAWRVSVGRAGREPEYRAALVAPSRSPNVNAINTRLPAAQGSLTVTLTLEGVDAGTHLRVALARDGRLRDERPLTAP